MVENRKGCVLGTRKCDPVNLAQVVHCVTRHGHHEFGPLARMVGRRSDALSRQTDGLREDLTLGLTIAITELQRDTRIVAELARCVGGVFVPLDTRAVSDADIHQAMLQAVREIGEDSGAIALALADGALTQDEADHILRELDETVQAVLAVKARVQAKVSQRPALLTRRQA